MKHFPPGYSFKIKDCSKRSDGEWHSRWTWELRNGNDDYVNQCESWGFDTMEDALNDLAEHIEKTYGRTLEQPIQEEICEWENNDWLYIEEMEKWNSWMDGSND